MPLTVAEYSRTWIRISRKSLCVIIGKASPLVW